MTVLLKFQNKSVVGKNSFVIEIATKLQRAITLTNRLFYLLQLQYRG